MKMTKQHFEAIAEIIKNSYDSAHRDDPPDITLILDSLVAELTALFYTSNPLFDRIKFLRACGLGDVR